MIGPSIPHGSNFIVALSLKQSSKTSSLKTVAFNLCVWNLRWAHLESPDQNPVSKTCSPCCIVMNFIIFLYIKHVIILPF